MLEGDIILVEFSPTVGHEQSGKRPALVGFSGRVQYEHGTGVGRTHHESSTKAYLGSCRSQKGLRHREFYSSHSPGPLDFRARRAHKLESVPTDFLEDVRARLRAVISYKDIPKNEDSETPIIGQKKGGRRPPFSLFPLGSGSSISWISPASSWSLALAFASISAASCLSPSAVTSRPSLLLTTNAFDSAFLDLGKDQVVVAIIADHVWIGLALMLRRRTGRDLSQHRL